MDAGTDGGGAAGQGRDRDVDIGATRVMRKRG